MSPAKPFADETLEANPRYKLRLFIAGMGPRSSVAIKNIHRICATRLAGRHELEIIDIHQQPSLAESNQVVAAPTLLKMEPEPVRWIIGDLSNEARVLRGLDISAAA